MEYDISAEADCECGYYKADICFVAAYKYIRTTNYVLLLLLFFEGFSS